MELPEHIESALRPIIALIVLYIGARVLGKHTLSAMNIFDFIATITIGSIAANMAFDISLKLGYMMLSFGLFIFFLYFMAFISLKSQKARKFLAGDPTVIVEDVNS